MAPRASKLTEALIRRRDDATVAWTFFREWLKAPLTTAAVSPSSQELAAEMLRELPNNPRRVVELGGGTGVFTEALLKRGFTPQHLLVFELNETLHQHLQQRFPETPIVCADARNIVWRRPGRRRPSQASAAPSPGAPSSAAWASCR